jgi:hypothetical protein
MRVSVASLVLVIVSLGAVPLRAQDPPPRIPPIVIDLHATVPKFPTDDPILASSRKMELSELPGRGLGVQIGAHLYVLRLKAITFGIGGEFVSSRASQTPPADQKPGAGTTLLRPTKERYTSLAPQISFNFGTGHGWSYLSGGVGRSTWSLALEGDEADPPNVEKLKTINYGGGGRWFMKSHVAFSFDVRFYATNPGGPNGRLPGSPRTTLLVIGAGMSVK